VADKKVTAINATFAKKAKIKKIPPENKKADVVMMDATIAVDGKVEQVSMPLPPRAFLSTFLVYEMLQGEKGLKVGTKYDYVAVAEEEGKVYNGNAFIEKLDTYHGIRSFRIINDFKTETPNSAKFISYVTEKGEAILTKSPMQSLSTELVQNAIQATQGFPVSTQNIQLLFGRIPDGKTNVLHTINLNPQGKPAISQEEKVASPKSSE
jgi:hypothetical protein